MHITEPSNRLGTFEWEKVFKLLAETTLQGEILQIAEQILRKDERFKDIVAEMKRLREAAVFREFIISYVWETMWQI